MSKKFSLLFLIGIHLIFFICLFYSQNNLDVIMLMAYLVIPLIFSLITCFIIKKVYRKKNKNYSIEKSDLLLIIPNSVYIIISTFIVNANMNNIYEKSMKYSSEYVDVSTSSSPILSTIMFIVVSIVLHYIVIFLLGKKDEVEKF